MYMPRQYSICFASAAALLIAMAPAASQAHSQHRTTHATRAAQTAEYRTTAAAKDQNREEHAKTQVLNRDSVVSVGPQASAFRRIRDIAMAPTG